MSKISQYPTITTLTGSELVLMDSGTSPNQQTVTATTSTMAAAFGAGMFGSQSTLFSHARALGGANGDPAIQIKSATPALQLVNTGAAADAKTWSIAPTTTDLIFALYNDAGNTSNTWLKVSRSGATPTGISSWGPVAAGLVDLTPDSGTFTCTLTGCTTSPTGTATWTRIGKLVVLVLPSITGTSNVNTMTYTGLPAAIQPATLSVQVMSIGSIENNSATVATGSASVAVGSGTITFYLAGGVTGFTNSGVKGLSQPCAISYLLN